jgi:hypothetical protein
MNRYRCSHSFHHLSGKQPFGEFPALCTASHPSPALSIRFSAPPCNPVLRRGSYRRSRPYTDGTSGPGGNSCVSRLGIPSQQRPARKRARPNRRKVLLMKTSTVHHLALAAAVAGLLGGTSARLNAQTAQHDITSAVNASGGAGVLVLAHGQNAGTAKHSCKGKNDCKGQGGCKSSDNGCKGKNSCKGKGGCATDGSKPSLI